MSEVIAYTVDGMTCGGCAKRVRTALENANLGLSDIKIDPKSGRVEVTVQTAVSDEDVRVAIEPTGYRFAGLASS